jgi:hypothetical protein
MQATEGLSPTQAQPLERGTQSSEVLKMQKAPTAEASSVKRRSLASTGRGWC